MLLVWGLTFIVAGLGYQPAISLWHWYGMHPGITILLIIFLG